MLERFEAVLVLLLVTFVLVLVVKVTKVEVVSWELLGLVVEAVVIVRGEFDVLLEDADPTGSKG